MDILDVMGVSKLSAKAFTNVNYSFKYHRIVTSKSNLKWPENMMPEGV